MPMLNKRVAPASSDNSTSAGLAGRGIRCSWIALTVLVGLCQNVTAQVGAATGAASAAPKTAARFVTPTPRTVPGILSAPRSPALATIQGNALRMNTGAVPNTVVRLRDARAGRVVGSEVTDKAGVFVFRGIEPGSYIAEVIGPNESVIASSQLISANAGQLTMVALKMPASLSQLSGILGPVAASNMALVAQAAAAGGVAAARAGTPVSER